jgi:orotate phosphoribosyltransferase
MSNSLDLAKQIAQILLEAKAVKISVKPPFTWTSGIKAPIYCDNRLLIAFPEFRKTIVEGFKVLIAHHKLHFNYVGGTATAGIPWAAFLAYELHLPLIYIRPEPKGHGAGKQIEGFLPEKSKVLLVEDLISTGGSSLKAAQAIENEGKSEVVSIISIMNYRLQQAEQTFSKADYHVYSLTSFSVLAELAHQMGVIEDVGMVLDFQKDPEGWAAKNL